MSAATSTVTPTAPAGTNERRRVLVTGLGTFWGGRVALAL